MVVEVKRGDRYRDSHTVYVDALFGVGDAGDAPMGVANVLTGILMGHGREGRRIDDRSQYDLPLGETTIKLRGFRATPGLDEFMDDFISQTEENPMNPRERIYGGCGIQAYKFGRNIHIGMIRALEPRRGHSERTLRWLISLADRHQVPLEGEVKAMQVDPRHMDQRSLEAWYARAGFRLNRGHSDYPSMLYTPRPRLSEDLAKLRRLAGIR